jgi:uncharacterized protein
MSSNSLRIFRIWNRILHRDIGYFFFGLTIIYCISGIALNHKKDWNPNYNITYKDIVIADNIDKSTVTLDWVMSFLKRYHEEDHYKKYFFPDSRTLKIFIDNGAITVNMESKNGYIEKITKRPFFFEINFLHYNPGKWWMWFSDIFCIGLIIIAITGLFIIAKSKNSLTRRGWWFILAGLVLPILALIIL